MVERNFDPDEFRPDPRERMEMVREREREQSRRDQDRQRSRQREEAMRRADDMQRREEQESMRRMADVVNDPSIEVDQEMVKAINDPEMVMMPTGEIARVTTRRMVRQRTGFGSGRFAKQFGSGMGFDLPKTKARKTKRRKNPKLASAFREANKRYRTKSGKLRKGRSQADIARLAHRILKQK